MAIKAQFSITLSRVDDGQKGEPGAAGVGVKLSVVTYQASTRGTSTPTGTWLSSIPAVDAGSYLWTRTITTMTDGTSSTAYSVALQGKTGPQGPKGSDITSYDSGLTLPSTVAPANSQFWLVDTNNIAIKFYKSNGSAWVEQQISASAINAATFNGLNFNGVTFTGSTFKSTFKDLSIDGYAGTLTGEATLANGQLNILGHFSDQSGAGAGRLFATSVTPSGWESYSTLADATPIDVASMNFGTLQLRQLISGNNTSNNAKYIQSDFKATDATTYERQVTPSDTANFSEAIIYYMRRGDQVTVTFKFTLTTDTGWVGLSSIPVGYTPAHPLGIAVPSLSYRGWNCTVYNNSAGWRLIPSSGQGKGGFQGSLSYVTYDGYPTDDAKTYIG
jgi:hypothetical protein